MVEDYKKTKTNKKCEFCGHPLMRGVDSFDLSSRPPSAIGCDTCRYGVTAAVNPYHDIETVLAARIGLVVAKIRTMMAERQVGHKKAIKLLRAEQRVEEEKSMVTRIESLASLLTQLKV